MDHRSAAVALAVRTHGVAGLPERGEGAAARLREAAAALGRAGPEFLAGPSQVLPEAVLMLPLSSAEAILPATLSVASVLRPAKTTFCAAVIPVARPAAGRARGSIDTAVIAAHRASSAAAAGVEETDPRAARFVLAGDLRDPVLASLLDLILESYDTMTARQRQIIELLRTSETQQEVASHLGVSRQAVNQSLAAAGWLHIRRAEETAEERLAMILADAAPATEREVSR